MELIIYIFVLINFNNMNSFSTNHLLHIIYNYIIHQIHLKLV